MRGWFSGALHEHAHCGSTVLDQVDSFGMRHVVRVVAINLNNLISNLDKKVMNVKKCTLQTFNSCRFWKTNFFFITNLLIIDIFYKKQCIFALSQRWNGKLMLRLPGYWECSISSVNKHLYINEKGVHKIKVLPLIFHLDLQLRRQLSATRTAACCWTRVRLVLKIQNHVTRGAAPPGRTYQRLGLLNERP